MSTGSKNTTDRLIKEFYEMFPHSPNPVTEPIKFAYYVRMYKWLCKAGMTDEELREKR